MPAQQPSPRGINTSSTAIVLAANEQKQVTNVAQPDVKAQPSVAVLATPQPPSAPVVQSTPAETVAGGDRKGQAVTYGGAFSVLERDGSVIDYTLKGKANLCCASEKFEGKMRNPTVAAGYRSDSMQRYRVFSGLTSVRQRAHCCDATQGWCGCGVSLQVGEQGKSREFALSTTCMMDIVKYAGSAMLCTLLTLCHAGNEAVEACTSRCDKPSMTMTRC